MPAIEIRTVHNVILSYKTATLIDRILAFLIDIFIVFALVVCLFLISELVSFDTEDSIFGLIAILIFSVYHLLSESVFDGQSIGKMAMGIKVLKLNGRTATSQDYFMRWSFRIVDILMSFGTLACILIGSSSRSQRLGDILANTVVVRIRERNTVRLRSLGSLKTKDTYEVSYPGAKKLSEAQALLIKNILYRHKKFPNTVSEALVVDLEERIKEKLEVSNPILTSTDFLQKVLKDYVVLTR